MPSVQGSLLLGHYDCAARFGFPLATMFRHADERDVVGFDLKLRKFNQLNEGKWQEYNTKLMSIPLPSAWRTAALSLRTDKRYAHPHYWAGFGILGAN